MVSVFTAPAKPSQRPCAGWQGRACCRRRAGRARQALPCYPASDQIARQTRRCRTGARGTGRATPALLWLQRNPWRWQEPSPQQAWPGQGHEACAKGAALGGVTISSQRGAFILRPLRRGTGAEGRNPPTPLNETDTYCGFGGQHLPALRQATRGARVNN